MFSIPFYFMNFSNVNLTTFFDLCLSCGICEEVCSRNAISIIFNQGIFQPKIDEKRCIDCKECLKYCPGYNFEDHARTVINQKSKKKNLKSFIIQTKDNKILKKSTSGGAISTILKEMLKDNTINYAFVVPNITSIQNQLSLISITKKNSIVNYSGSKYLPISLQNLIEFIKQKKDAKIAIIGTGCIIYSIQKLLEKYKINNKYIFFFGLFCDKSLNYNILNYFAELVKDQELKIVNLKFRSKDRVSWPGNTKITLSNNKIIYIDKNQRMNLKKFYQLNRCRFCIDKLNYLSDISFGDNYIPGLSSEKGSSSIIIRTQKGYDIFEKYKKCFTFREVSNSVSMFSQNITMKIENHNNIKKMSNLIKKIQNSNRKVRISSNSSLKNKNIQLGKENKINLIKLKIFASRYIKILKNLFTKFEFILNFLIIAYINKNKKKLRAFPSQYVILGGNFLNKGAESMTLHLIDQIYQKNPSSKIYLFSNPDFWQNSIKIKKFNLEILPWNFKIKQLLLNKLSFESKNTTNDFFTKKIDQVLKESKAIYDISGFALTSYFSLGTSLEYLMNISIAKKYSVPMYILPQSFGPFNYKKRYRFFIISLIKSLLTYPELIMCREKDGLMNLKALNLNNIYLNPDFVLLSKIPKLNRIFNDIIKIREISILDHSIAIIPNYQLLKRSKKTQFYAFYSQIIRFYSDLNKNIYLISHSNEDLKICLKIYDKIQPNNKKSIFIIKEVLSSLQFLKIVKKFDFIIASRYHAVIHSFKQSTPAIVIGWAIKYKELMDLMNQSKYILEIDSPLIKIETVLSDMNLKFQLEKANISQRLKKLMKMDFLTTKLDIF
ncbi:MAG: Coenzyme F420 hydrogenase/dehydrogenase, beta subunit C-terminal domain [Candidatus Helarchaeota archaeon]